MGDARLTHLHARPFTYSSLPHPPSPFSPKILFSPIASLFSSLFRSVSLQIFLLLSLSFSHCRVLLLSLLLFSRAHILPVNRSSCSRTWHALLIPRDVLHGVNGGGAGRRGRGRREGETRGGRLTGAWLNL